MKKFTKLLCLTFATLGLGISANAQCAAGEAEVTVDVTTDDWGYETYWEYTPEGNTCGTGTLGTYGNTLEVGCAGGGNAVATAGNGYASNVTITENLGCLTIGSCFDLHYVDDWGDGGASFEVFVDGVSVYNFVGTGVGNTFTFCVESANAFDAAISALVKYEYTAIPLAHTPAITLGAEITNAGTNAITNAVVDVEVLQGGTSVYTESSTPIATMASGASEIATFANFAPTVTGIHTIEFTASMDEVDENITNDTLSYEVDITDTVFARDNGIPTGSLGIGAGAGSDARLGQSFTPGVDDSITSATAVFAAPTEGDSTAFAVFNMAAGLPDAMIAQSNYYIFTAADAADGLVLTMPFNTPVPVTAGNDFVLCVIEEANNVTLATTGEVVTPGTNWVTWAGNPNGAGTWSNSEEFGFEVQYLLRANFGQNEDDASIEEFAFNVGAYPNPTKDFLNLDVPSELVGEQYSVYDQTGRLMTQGVVDELSTKVDMSSFEKGMYYVTMNAVNVTLRVIKQ